uniref:Holliday junction resolvase n=1 Tax=Tetraselmis sp. GSL018 TaxID=582737 RepID=A0A061S1Y6_9CHLO|mmetsp:Transcript_42910/g.101886  ORF Transcript_42910/g.101886 Transcript_42910/m.101886 type:complete len:281 (+) Transcript_42910:236-1078(+)
MSQMVQVSCPLSKLFLVPGRRATLSQLKYSLRYESLSITEGKTLLRSEKGSGASVRGISTTRSLTNRSAIVGIDPDTGGALAAMCLSLGTDSAQFVSSEPVSNFREEVQQIVSGLDRAEMQLHDTPCLKVKIGKTMRRRPDLDAIVDLAAQLRQWAASEDVMVFIEQPRPQPINGSISCYSSGLLFGTWCGVMRASGFRVLPVEPTVWKRDLELCHADKERSRALALELFPRMADMLRRKKDHGRAEAMLLAAWGACSHARQMAQGSPVDENGAAREAQR